MNLFLKAAIDTMSQHLVSIQYVSVSAPAYNEDTSSVSSTETIFNVKAYPKQIQANAYNFPNLIEKEVILLYLINNSLGFVPSIRDSVNIDGENYKVYSIEKKHAGGSLILYKILIVRG